MKITMHWSVGKVKLVAMIEVTDVSGRNQGRIVPSHKYYNTDQLNTSFRYKL